MKPRNIKFFKESNDILKNIIKLPDELVDIIYSYVPTTVKTVLSKNNYLAEHKLIRQTINKNDIENYIRTMIRQDNSFVFEQLLIENYDKWINIKEYYYKECIYMNYLMFLEFYIMDNESIKCKKILAELFEELGFNKNQHKKKSFKYIII